MMLARLYTFSGVIKGLWYIYLSFQITSETLYKYSKCILRNKLQKIKYSLKNIILPTFSCSKQANTHKYTKFQHLIIYIYYYK